MASALAIKKDSGITSAEDNLEEFSEGFEEDPSIMLNRLQKLKAA